MLRLKELREAQVPHLSQEKLAQKAGVSLKTVRRAERTGRAKSTTLEAFAKALKVGISELFAPEREAS